MYGLPAGESLPHRSMSSSVDTAQQRRNQRCVHVHQLRQPAEHLRRQLRRQLRRERATSVLYSCGRLVGGTGYVAPSTAGASALSIGASGVLTDLTGDSREWVWAHLYDDHGLEIISSPTPDASRTLVISGAICVNARYQTGAAMPWHDRRRSVHARELKADVASVAT